MKIDESEFFRRATLLITSSLNFKTVLQRIERLLRQHMPSSGMAVGLYDADAGRGKMLTYIKYDDIEVPQGWIKYTQDEQDFLIQGWTGPDWVRIVNNVETDDVKWRNFMSKYSSPDYSHLMMDLKLKDRRMGTLFISAKGTRQYNEYHAHLFELLQAPFSIALHNYLLHHEYVNLYKILADDHRYLQKQITEITGDAIIGREGGLKQVMSLVRQVAPLNSPILLLGETGVGKEVVANAIHGSSRRKMKPFIKVNCGAIPENLIDSELFGHEKGAFTGAVSQKRGRFERAHTGTIFLDEIGELPLSSQVSLLRVLQEMEIERVGGSETIPVDVRIISASNRNLEEMVKAGEFREDLWFRLNVVPVIIPPLRQRTGDIPSLVEHFLERKSKEMKIRDKPVLTAGALDAFLAYDWPGNVRELENLVERALILNQMKGGKLALTFEPTGAPAALPELQSGPILEPGEEELMTLDESIRRQILKTLEHTGGIIGGKGGAAQILGLNSSTLRSRMRKMGIPFGRKILNS